MFTNVALSRKWQSLATLRSHCSQVGGEELEILVAWAHKSREPVKRGDFFFTVARNVFFVLSIELASYRQNFRA